MRFRLVPGIKGQAMNYPGGSWCLRHPSAQPLPEMDDPPWMNPLLPKPTFPGQSTEPISEEGTAPSLKSWPFPWKSVPPQPEATTSPAATTA